MVARTVLLQFWWPTRRHADRQERVPSKGKSVAALFFSAQGTRTTWFCDVSRVDEGNVTRINSLCSTRFEHQQMVSFDDGRGVDVGWFRVSFFVNAACSCHGTVVVAFGTFDFGGNSSREDGQNNTLAHVMMKGIIWCCRRTLMFSPITYSKHLQ